VARIFVPSIAFVALALWGCGLSSRASVSDAEGAIVAKSHHRLTAPSCEDAVGQEGESGETSFYCSAADHSGRRVKLFVSFNDRSGEALVLAWPCAPASLSWREVRHDPAHRCGVLVGRR
jgi:hypothetical protein